MWDVLKSVSIAQVHAELQRVEGHEAHVGQTLDAADLVHRGTEPINVHRSVFIGKPAGGEVRVPGRATGDRSVQRGSATDAKDLLRAIDAERLVGRDVLGEAGA